MTHAWTLDLTMSGPRDLIRAHFVALVDRYAEIESADPRLVDCSWTLSQEPATQSGCSAAARARLHELVPRFQRKPWRLRPATLALDGGHDQLGKPLLTAGRRDPSLARQCVVAPEWITLKDVGRREVDPIIYDLLTHLTRDGWRLRRQGHKFYVFCPCGDPAGRIRIDGTPRNPTLLARRARREAGHCPNRHDLDG